MTKIAKETTASANILEAMLAVMNEVGAIGKDHRNSTQNYDYRGVEDYFNVLQPIFLAHKILPVPMLTDLIREEHTSSKGTVSVFTVARIDYHFTHVPTGELLVVPSAGEGSDTGDKSLNKAYSSAFKNCLTQLLSIPTKDADNSEDDKPEPKTPAKPAAPSFEEQKARYNDLQKLFFAKNGEDKPAFKAYLSERGVTVGGGTIQGLTESKFLDLAAALA